MQTVPLTTKILRAAAIGFALSALATYVWFRAESSRKEQKRTRMASTKRSSANIVEIYQSARKSKNVQAPDSAKSNASMTDEDALLASILREAPAEDPIEQALAGIQESEDRKIERRLEDASALEEHRLGSTKSSLLFGPEDLAAFDRIQLTPDDPSAAIGPLSGSKPAETPPAPEDPILEKSLRVLSHSPNGTRASGSKSTILLKTPDWLRIKGLWQNHDKSTDPGKTSLIEAPAQEDQP